MKTPHLTDAAALRRAAEAQVAGRVPAATPPTESEVLRLRHELEVHQIELEMQNEELRAAQAEVEAGLERYTNLFDFAPVGYFNLTEDGTIRLVNLTGATLVGLERGRLLGRRLGPFVAESDRRAFSDFLALVFSGGAPQSCELGLAAEGRPPVGVRLAATLSPDGKECRAALIDITDRRQAEERLDASVRENDHLRSAMDEHALVAITDAHGRIKFVNDKFCAISQYAREELLGADHRMVNSGLHPKEFIGEMWETINAGRVWHGELRNRAKDGSFYWLDTTIVPFLDEHGKPWQHVAIRTDITERKRVENDLRVSSVRFRSVFQSNPAAIAITRLATGEVVDANERTCEFFGRPAGEFLGKTTIELGVWQDAEQRDSMLNQVRATGSVREMDVKLKRGTGEVRDVLMSMERMDVPGEAEPLVISMFIDVTERKQAEHRFRRLVESSAQGVLFWNVDGRITGANDAFLEMVGYSREDLAAGRINWIALTPPEYAERDRRTLEEIALHGVCAPFEKEYIRKDGSRVPLLVGAAAFEDSPQEGVCFVVDLTERKHLEQQFLRAQRLESIGTLAGGMAHDLNNSLTPVIMSLALLRQQLPDPASQELLDIVAASAQRGADMVRQVLSFARGVVGRRVEVPVQHLIQEVETIANETFLKHIRVRTSLPADLWMVLGDPTQIHQVLLNLCVNARDAMPDGGTLTITAENIVFDEHYAGMILDAKPGPYVFIEVKDTGTGIPPAVLDKIFDPFFTTKEVGKGTGLGLSTAAAIVKSHGGFIHVYSDVGKGTRFHLNFPALTMPVTVASSVLPAVLPRGNGELILVVDDEASVRKITQRTLESYGYQVVLATDGTEAVSIFAERGAEIAVVLTDMMMPVMDGAATIRVLRRMRPEVRVIAASGLPDRDQVAQAAGLDVEHFLPKPYTAEHLLKTLKAILKPG